MVCLMLCLVSGAAHAQSMAVVDADILINNSKAAQSIKAQMETRRTQFQRQFSDKKQSLQEKEKKLLQQKDSLSQEELSTKIQTFREELLQEQQRFQNRKSALNEAFSEALTKLRNEIRNIAADIAQQQGFSLVIAKEAVIYTGQNNDITSAVLEELDRRRPSIRVGAVE